jgi:SAM-dependent methyltransferase
MLLNLVTPLHESTKRDYMARLMDDKIACMKKAREFERDYWDGERRYGYGGYKYDERWKVVAQRLLETYDLDDCASVLDIGCGKGHLLYELQKLNPSLKLFGMDRSLYALNNMPADLKADCTYAKCQHGIAFDRRFDLIVSLGTLHNLTLSELWRTIPEIKSKSNDAYIMVESFRNEAEWFNLTAWCLTAETIMRPEDWCFLFDKCGYRGDFEFIFFR